MAVDNTLRYRGFNSYELAPNETLYSSLSDCEYLGFVTTQWVALKVGGTIAGGSVRITWIDDTGGQFGSAELYEFTPTRLWERYTWTVAVPPEAVKLRIQFDGGIQGYHFACPMTEPGKIASSFDPSIASSVAYMTSKGAYVGMIAANQVIVSSGEGLEERLVKISGDAIRLETELDNKTTSITADAIRLETKLDDKTTLITADGVYTGTVKAEQLEGGTVYAKEPVVYGPFTEADSDLLQEFILGTKTPTEAQMKKYDLTMDGLLNSHDSIAIYRIRMGLTSGTRYGAVRILPPSPDHVGGIFIGSGEEEQELDETNTFFYMSGGTFKGKTAELYNSITTPVVKGWNPSGTAMVEGTHAVGVDSSGPYFTKSGTRSYLDTPFNATAITWTSTDRVWHDKPAGFYRTTGDGTSLGYLQATCLFFTFTAGQLFGILLSSQPLFGSDDLIRANLWIGGLLSFYWFVERHDNHKRTTGI